MKKIVSILIVFTLMLTFASCGSNSTQSEEFSEPIPHNNESNSAPAGESDNQGNSSKAPAPESDPTGAWGFSFREVGCKTLTNRCWWIIPW